MSPSLQNAIQGSVDVRFTPSLPELKVLVRFNPDRPFYIALTILSRIGAFALAAGLTAIVLWSLNAFQPNVLEGVTLAIAGGLAGLMAFRFLVERPWRKRIHAGLLHPIRELHVSSDGTTLMIDDGDAQSRIAFSAIDRLVPSSSHLILYRNRAPLVALPKAAFENAAVFDAFASFLKGFVAAHHTSRPIAEKTS